MSKLHPQYEVFRHKQEKLLSMKNEKTDFYNGIYDRWKNPVLTREHIPLTWCYDLDEETNPYFMERLGINAAFNSGAIELNGKYYLVARIDGNDRKSFFGVAESDSPVEGFRFWDKPVELPDTCPEETNVYDMRLTILALRRALRLLAELRTTNINKLLRHLGIELITCYAVHLDERKLNLLMTWSLHNRLAAIVISIAIKEYFVYVLCILLRYIQPLALARSLIISHRTLVHMTHIVELVAIHHL